MAHSADSMLHPVVPESQNITVEKLKKFLPRGSSTQVTDEIVAMINRAEEETGIDQNLVEEQVVSYMHLLTGSVSVEKLVNAIKFCNLRLLPGMGNARAYSIVFPAKTTEITDRGQSVDSFASMYNSTRLVIEINKLLIVPAYITYQPLHHAAIKKQLDLMNGIGAKEDDKVSAHVQHLAAGKLAELTAMPIDHSIELKIGMNDEAKSVQQALTDQLAAVVDMQMAKLDAGQNIGDVQKLNISVDEIIEAEVE